MSILSHYMNRVEARMVAQELKDAGFKVTAKDCQEFVANIVSKVGGMDLNDQRQIREIIERTLA